MKDVDFHKDYKYKKNTKINWGISEKKKQEKGERQKNRRKAKEKQ